MSMCVDSDTLCPVTQPLITARELLDWTPGGNDPCRSRTPYPGPRKERHDRPRLLACHDFKYVYVEDRFAQEVCRDDCYNFSHWWEVDVFVYFSHRFVTLPPCGWIDSGHRHGVKILGTLIVEWEAGAKICEEILSEEQTMRLAADKLVSLAQYYGFDGWLINVEVELSADQMPNLLEFVRYLTKGMHRCIKHSEVIWYDSIIADGHLKWQNELNANNRHFFDACDGIFLNYGWTEHGLQSSANIARQCDRLYDIFVGVDVFGRGCFGGGGFNTNKAMEVTKRLDLSVALFAFGWTYEMPEKGECFIDRDTKFWSLLRDLCPKRKLRHLPLVTSFCRGWGHRCYSSGRVLCDKPWTCLALQQVQPTEDCNTDAMKYSTSDGYSGGGCLEITPSEDIRHICLFSADVVVLDDLYVIFTYKARTSVEFTLQLTFLTSDGDRIVQHCIADGSDGSSCSFVAGKTIDTTTSQVNVGCLMPVDKSDIAGEGGSIWSTRHFIVKDMINHRLTDISVFFPDSRVNPAHNSFNLGELRLIPEELMRMCKSLTDSLMSTTGGSQMLLCQLEMKESSTLSMAANEKHATAGSCVGEELSPQSVNPEVKDSKQLPSSINDANFNIKLTWELPSETLAQISCFHVFAWSKTEQSWCCLGRTPICVFGFSSAESTGKDFDLGRFRIEISLANGSVLPGMDLKVSRIDKTALND